MRLPYNSFYFVGIGGIGMSAIAKILLQKGYKVSGSDLKTSPIVEELKRLGADIVQGHTGENIPGNDVVVVSTAIPADNPEYTTALSLNIPILRRAQMLALLMKDYCKIAVTGTHGKTTSTSMVTFILEKAGLSPTWVIGGELNDFGSNGDLGSGRYFVAEADESDASFLELSPDIAVVTSMDVDVNLNVNIFGELNFDYEKISQKVRNMFLAFIDSVKNDDGVILCSDNPNIRMVLSDLKKKYLTYGTNASADLQARNVQFSGVTSWCEVYYHGEFLGELRLKVPGLHNILNALGACAVGLRLGLKFNQMAEYLLDFHGVARRFEILGEEREIMVVDDYAHNPAKIKAAVKAARGSGRKRVVAVFQPHRYSRTKLLFDQYKTIFSDNCDLLVVTRIYSAGEKPIEGVSGEALAKEIKAVSLNTQVTYLPQENEVLEFLHRNVQAGDLVIMLGAGDITNTAHTFAQQLKRPQETLVAQKFTSAMLV